VARKKVAIVGSRDWKEPARILDCIDELGDVEIVSGGARGVDRIAAQYAKIAGLETKEFIADWERHGKMAGFIRNTQIVDYCDELIAFWDMKSKGTADSIRRAQEAGKPVRVETQND
jgi:hypothetical protein